MSRTRLDTLRRLAPFSGCSDKELRRLDSLLDEATVPAGKELTAVGQHGTQAFVVVAGAAEARIGDRHLADFGPGDVIGEMALLDRRAGRVATVVTTEATTLLVMDPRSFETVMAQFPSVARHIATVLAQRLRAADVAVEDLAG